MAITGNINPLTASTLSTTGSTTANAGGAAAIASVANQRTIAGTFDTFLTLLTTQLKNQNPLDPLDTNQFTQQLVQFAQVEQQIRQNDQLTTLIALEQASQASTALAFVGTTVAVDGQTAALSKGQATWHLNAPKLANATIAIRSSTGQTVYTTTMAVSPGTQPFIWNGKDNKGTDMPEGNYTISVTAKDSNGQAVAIPTEVEGIVDSIDLTKMPPVLSIGGQKFTLDKIKRVARPHA
jgi:flagellar basal-body rod modification protein FlgD